MLHKNALALLLFLPAIWLSAQPYQEDWDQILGDFARESSIRQLYQAANGAVYAVGQFRAVANDQDGLLLRLDESTGKVESQTPFSRSGDDGLTDLCAAPAGGLWLAGFSANARGEGRYPRLIQVDYQLAPVKDRVFTELADEQFTHVAAFANGDLLLCGRYENRRETALAFYFFRQGQLVAVDALQNYRSLLENVVDVLPSPDERTLYIVANSRRGRGSEEGRLYILALRDDGNPPSVFQTSENEYYVARAATLSPEGDILLTGEIWEPGRTRLWAASFDTEQWAVTTHETEAAPGHQAGYAIGAVPEGHHLVLCETEEVVAGATFRKQEMMRGNELLRFTPFYELGRGDNYEAHSALMTYARRLLVAGKQQAGRNRAESRCFAMAPVGMYSTSRGQIDVECSEPRLLFGNGDNQLSPGEQVDIAFEITNTGEVPIWDGQVHLVQAQLVEGITLPPPNSWFIPALGVGVTRLVKIPLIAGDNLAFGQSTLTFEINTGGQALKKVLVNLQSTLASGGFGPLLTVDHPSADAPERAIPSPTDTFTIRVKTFSDHALERENFRTVQNSVLLQDSKDMDSRLSAPVRQGQLLEQTYSVRVRLREGVNEIRISIDDGYHAPEEQIRYIEYQPLQPSLHVLAIAPDYTGFASKGYSPLNFNDDDARDFVAAVSSQRNAGLYRQVFIDTLLNARNTHLDSLERALNELVRRTEDVTRPDYIAQNDVVMLFISGHGDLMDDRDFALIPSNFDPEYDLATSLDYNSRVLRYLRRLDRKTLLFIDACHSGSAGNKGAGLDTLMSNALFRLNQAAPGLLAFQSCREGENSYENDRWRNGAFTEALLEALSGKEITLAGGTETLRADADQDGYLSLKEIMDYTGRRVPLLLRQAGLDFPQHPQVTDIDERQRFELGLDFFRVGY